MDSHPNSLVTKQALATRYGVCVRTISYWMRRRIVPFIKLSPKVVRFDVVKCDVAIEVFETRSICDPEIRAELARRRAASGMLP